MSLKLNASQLNDVKNAQNEARRILGDKKAFNDAFEKTFSKYDKNRDGRINMREYIQFLKDILNQSGRKNYDLPVAMLNYEGADIDNDGNIDKAEFKKEFSKRMREFASHIF